MFGVNRVSRIIVPRSLETRQNSRWLLGRHCWKVLKVYCLSVLAAVLILHQAERLVLPCAGTCCLGPASDASSSSSSSSASSVLLLLLLLGRRGCSGVTARSLPLSLASSPASRRALEPVCSHQPGNEYRTTPSFALFVVTLH